MNTTVITRAEKHKRVRQVYPVDMVAHLWAHKAQDSAAIAATAISISTATPSTVTAHTSQLLNTSKQSAGRAVLFTTRDYSVTTSGHMWTVLGACKHLTVFHVEDPTATDRKAQFVEYRQRCVELARKYSRARSNKPWILDSLRDVVDEANRFAQFFGLRSRLSMPTDLSAMEAECRAVEKRERVRKQREETRRQREWEAQEGGSYGPGLTSGPTMAQSTVGHSAVMTCRFGCESRATNCRPLRGARVPLDHAIKAFRTIKRLRERGQAYQRNGHTIHLGQFALDAIDALGNVRAGCHNVTWDEIERVATIAGVN